MSEETAINIPIFKLEEFSCFTCEGYLSTSPIGLLRNGNFICGQCTSLSPNKSIYRALQLEAILSEALFPCHFKKHGCMERIPFGQTVKHESTCAFRIFTCPSFTSCSWEGFTSQLLDHYYEKHYSLIKEKAEFKFQLDEDTEESFIVIKENLVFIVKYKYKGHENFFNCDIRYYCPNNIEQDATYRVKLINGLDFDCSINLKTSKCILLDNSFYEGQNGINLNLNKFVEILNNPSCVVVIDLEPGNKIEKIENFYDIINVICLCVLYCKLYSLLYCWYSSV